MKTLSIKIALKTGWEKTKEHFWALLGVGFIDMFVNGILSYFNKDQSCYGILIFVINLVFSIIILRMLLNIFNESELFDKMEDSFSMFWNYLLGTLIYSALVFVGILFLIIPGIIFSIKYQFVPYLIIDKKMSFSEAFTVSNQMASGVQMELFGFMIISPLILVLGFLCLGIGIFVAIPIVWMAFVYIYKHLYEEYRKESKK